MTIYKLTARATRMGHMGQQVHDTSEHYIAAYDYAQAQWHVHNNLTKAGWYVDGIDGKEIYLHDIRDSCDHTTD